MRPLGHGAITDKKREFLRELTDLSHKHGVYIDVDAMTESLCLSEIVDNGVKGRYIFLDDAAAFYFAGAE